MARQKFSSRRKTPWDGGTKLTPVHEFLKNNYEEHYEDHRLLVCESRESEMVNSFVPKKCPYCGAIDFKKSGRTKSGFQQFMCSCGRTFLPTTGTIFEDHRISISEWMEYCLNLFRHVSLNADSWNNKNAMTTSRYWLKKLFLTLEGCQDNIVLSGNVWLDETFYSVRAGDKVLNENSTELRGLSGNQICIGVATDKAHTIFFVEGNGKPSQKKTFDTFKNHIEPGSHLIHDKEAAHRKLVQQLNLINEVYASADLKGLADKDTPLYPINHAHAILKHFLNSHGGFDRDDLQGYLNLFSFVTNPPKDMLEKVEIVLKTAFENPKSLHYRDIFSSNTSLQ